MSVNFKTIFLVAHISAFALGSSNDNWSGYVYYPELLGYLKLHTEPADWLTARVNCHNEDAILASPWTSDFTSAVYKLQSSSDQLLPLIFSGALVTFPEEAYYRERLPDELIGVQRCGIFLASGTTGEIDCHIKLPFVCYATNARLLTSAPTSESTTTPKTIHKSGTTFSPRTVTTILPTFKTTTTTTPTPKTTTTTTTTPEPTTTTTTTTEPTTTTTEPTTTTTTTTKPTTTTTTTTEPTTTTTTTTEPTTTTTTTSKPTTITTPKTTTTTRLAPTGGKPSCEGSGYELYSQTGHCYKFHSIPKKWTDANNTCTIEGARLVVINSDVEARVIVSVFGQYPASSLKAVVAKSDRDLASVGMFWNFDDWRTLDGQTIEEAGYSSWRDGLPYNATFYPYGGVHRDGTFNNVSNKADLTFICEKVPV